MKKKFNGFNCIQKANPTRHCSDRKCAFTLAETMVVVVVLGIIATLTIPALVNKNKESVAKTKVRKAVGCGKFQIYRNNMLDSSLTYVRSQ